MAPDATVRVAKFRTSLPAAHRLAIELKIGEETASWVQDLGLAAAANVGRALSRPFPRGSSCQACAKHAEQADQAQLRWVQLGLR